MARQEKLLSVADILDLIEHKNPQSLRALARRVGVSPTTVMAWRDGRAVPSDSHGLTLAALAGVDPACALIWLAFARSDCPECRAAWRAVLVEHLQAI